MSPVITTNLNRSCRMVIKLLGMWILKKFMRKTMSRILLPASLSQKKPAVGCGHANSWMVRREKANVCISARACTWYITWQLFFPCLDVYVTSNSISRIFISLEQTWRDGMHTKEQDQETGPEDQVKEFDPYLGLKAMMFQPLLIWFWSLYFCFYLSLVVYTNCKGNFKGFLSWKCSHSRHFLYRNSSPM